MTSFINSFQDPFFVCSVVCPERATVLLRRDDGYLAIFDNENEPKSFDDIVSFVGSWSHEERTFSCFKSDDLESLEIIDRISREMNHPKNKVAQKRLREILSGSDANIAVVASTLVRSYKDPGFVFFTSSDKGEVSVCIEKHASAILINSVENRDDPDELINTTKDPRLEKAWGKIELPAPVLHPNTGQELRVILVPPGSSQNDEDQDYPRRIVNRAKRMKKLIELKAPNAIMENEFQFQQENLDRWFEDSNCASPESDYYQGPPISLLSEDFEQAPSISLAFVEMGFVVQTPNETFKVDWEGKVEAFGARGGRVTNGTMRYLVFESKPNLINEGLDGVALLDLQSKKYLRAWPERSWLANRFSSTTKGGCHFVFDVAERIARPLPFRGKEIARTESLFWSKSDDGRFAIVGNGCIEIPCKVTHRFDDDFANICEGSYPSSEVNLVFALEAAPTNNVAFVSVPVPAGALAYAYEGREKVAFLMPTELLHIAITNINDFLEPEVSRRKLPEVVCENLLEHSRSL